MEHSPTRRQAVRILLILFIGPALSGQELTLEQIMAHPDWIGREPQQPYWSDDGAALYYRQKREGDERVDLAMLRLDTGLSVVLDAAGQAAADVGRGHHDRSRTRKLFERNGDLFLKDLATGEVRALTRTSERESRPRFLLGEDRFCFQRGGDWFLRSFEGGEEWQVADLRSELDPEAEAAKKDEEAAKAYLTRQQSRLFDIIRKRKDREQAAREWQEALRKADPLRSPEPWYLGSERRSLEQVLSPTAEFLLVRVAPREGAKPRRDQMPEFVTRDGYVETSEVRPHVGEETDRAEQLLLLDLGQHQLHELDLSVLPELCRDPLAEIRSTPLEGDPKPRPVSITDVAFSDDGAHAAFQAFSADNKDRWIARVDLADHRIVLIDHIHDEAWINWAFRDMEWIAGEPRLYYLSEESGYSHLYVHDATNDATHRLTEGEFEVSAVQPTRDGRFFYFCSTAVHPGIQEVFRLDRTSGEIQQVTQLGGQNEFQLSPDESMLLVEHSEALQPPELYVQLAEPDHEAQRMTFTVSEAFLACAFTTPRFVEVPSRAGRPIHARLYLPEGDAAAGSRPAVLFIHGAGYLQNAHQGWSGYFREFMFHSLLAQRGYVVLDMDYRASKGYGRDWRTAIYRQMGTPELEDLEDGVRWIVAHHGVDPTRVGTYGGSYGGFLTLMALFRKPELFAAGAALRPVTDWAHYNHSYTSNILNTPAVDPEAYERSSPIEFAAGLTRPLLMCHGMLDDNVVFQDSVRLVQRLIELKKENWEVAIYPVEPHGFREPESWLDEYRRILKLFETHVRATR